MSNHLQKQSENTAQLTKSQLESQEIHSSIHTRKRNLSSTHKKTQFNSQKEGKLSSTHKKSHLMKHDITTQINESGSTVTCQT